jgi:hypothetical protein
MPSVQPSKNAALWVAAAALAAGFVGGFVYSLIRPHGEG